MLLAEDLAAERQGLRIERLGLAIAPLALVQQRQVVHAGEGVGMLLAEDLAAERQGLA